MAVRHFALAALLGLSLAACEEERTRGSARHNIPIPSATYTLMSEKGMSKSQPIVIRSYKKESELEIWKKRDAVLLAREQLAARLGEDELVSLEASIKAMVQEAVRFAEQSPVANPAHLWDYVYATAGTDPKRM